jgi:hypothetical protein
VLNRIFRFTRRQEPQAFPLRKRSMADSCFGQPDLGVSELDTFVEDALPPGAPLFPAPPQPVAAPPRPGHLLPSKPEASPTPAVRQEAPARGAAPLGGSPGAAVFGTRVKDAALALEQMRPKIEAGRLVVFGPAGEPVPPYAFAAAAAARPDTPVRLPDGTTAPASQFAAVLGAQILGRLGEAEHGAGWIVAMLRDGGQPEAGDQTAAGEHAQALADAADAVLATPPGNVFGDRAAPDQAALDQAGTGLEPSPETLRPVELDLEQVVASTGASLDFNFSADRIAAGPEQDVDPDSIVLVMIRGVPEGAVLSAGIRDDDGTWLLSPLDLPTVTIKLTTQGSGDDAAGAGRGADGELSITGIAIAQNGELVAISEVVPLTDYLAYPAAGQPART